MNKEDIIRMAREAGEGSTWKPGTGNEHVVEYLERFAALVAAAERAEMAKHCVEITRVAVTKAVDGAIALEREACAKVVEASPSYDWHRFACEAAAAIRARGQA